MTHESGARFTVRFIEAMNGEVVFGLPGSTMVSLMHSLRTSSVPFVGALHESSAVAMADGYARIKGPVAALLYMLPGTLNGLANLYNAWRDETPLLVLASQQAAQARTHQGTVGEGDTSSLVRDFTRFAWEVRDRAQLAGSLETALARLTGPPCGPSFVAIPEDVLSAEAPVAAIQARERVRAGAPVDVSGVRTRLIEAKRPVVVVGGQVRRTGGVGALEQLAEDLALPVFVEPFWNDRIGITPSHPCYLGPFTERSRLIREADAVLAVGCRVFNEVHPIAEPWFSGDTFVAHVNADPLKLDETQGAAWSSTSDPALFLEALLESRPSLEVDASLHQARWQRLNEARQRRQGRNSSPLGVAVAAIADTLDAAWIVDESVSGNFQLTAALHGSRGDHFLSTTGGSLGWGMGAAVGVALATNEPVLCSLGDGAFFFGLQALAPARARNLPITYVVLDNAGFGSTRFFEDRYVQRHSEAGPPGYVGSDFRGLGLSVADVARGFGIPATNLPDPSHLRGALERRLHGVIAGPEVYVVSIPFE